MTNPVKIIMNTYREIKSLKTYAKENGIVDVEKFIKEYLKMKRYKDQINRMVADLVEMESNNQAVCSLAILLGLINQITSAPTPEYSQDAIRSLMKIGVKLVSETGTPVEQFELMARMTGQDEISEEE